MSISIEEFGKLQTQLIQLKQDVHQGKEREERLKAEYGALRKRHLELEKALKEAKTIIAKSKEKQQFADLMAKNTELKREQQQQNQEFEMQHQALNANLRAMYAEHDSAKREAQAARAERDAMLAELAAWSAQAGINIELDAAALPSPAPAPPATATVATATLDASSTAGSAAASAAPSGGAAPSAGPETGSTRSPTKPVELTKTSSAGSVKSASHAAAGAASSPNISPVAIRSEPVFADGEASVVEHAATVGSTPRGPWLDVSLSNAELAELSAGNMSFANDTAGRSLLEGSVMTLGMTSTGTEDLRNVSEQISRLETQLTTVTMANAELQEQLERIRLAGGNEDTGRRLTELERANAALRKDVEDHRTQLELAQQELKRAQRKREQAEGQLKASKTEAEDAKDALQTMRASRDSFETKFSQLKESRTELAETSSSQAQQIALLKDTLRQLTSDFDGRAGEHAAMSKRLEEQTAKMEVYQTQAVSLSETIQEKEKEYLTLEETTRKERKRAADLEEEKRRIEGERSSEMARAEAALATVAELEAKIADLDTRLAAAGEERAKLEGSVASLEAEVAALKTTVEQREAELREITTKFQQAKEERAKAAEEAAGATARAEEAEKGANDRVSEMEQRLVDQEAEHKIAIRKQQTQLRDLQSQLRKPVKTVVSKAASASKASDQESEGTEASMEVLQHENEELMRRLEASQRDKWALEEQTAAMKQHASELTKELASKVQILQAMSLDHIDVLGGKPTGKEGKKRSFFGSAVGTEAHAKFQTMFEEVTLKNMMLTSNNEALKTEVSRLQEELNRLRTLLALAPGSSGGDGSMTPRR